ncbi:hypothetical protein D9M72_596800 [compost metagenome]
MDARPRRFILIHGAPVARQPDRHRQLFFLGPFRRKVCGLFEHQAGLGEPIGDYLMREAKARMGVFVAQMLEPVRRKVDDDKTTARHQHACSFRNRRLRLVEEMQHLVNGDEIEGVPVERQVEDIAVAD